MVKQNPTKWAVVATGECRGLFFLPHQTKPKALNFLWKAQGKLSPVVYGSRKQEVMALGHQIKLKTQVGPLNPKHMSTVVTWGPPE